MRTARFWNKLHQVRKEIERLQSQIIFKVLGAIKQKDLNRNFSFINNISSHRHHCQIFTTMYATFTPILQ